MSENSRTIWGNNVILLKEEEYLNRGIFDDFDKVWVIGILMNEFEYSHEDWNGRFYKNTVRVRRISGVEDFVPIVVSELLIRDTLGEAGYKGKCVEIGGVFESNSEFGEDGKKHLELFLFANLINIYEESEVALEKAICKNLIYLDGYICKPTIYRRTPFGREITDLFIAVNTTYGRSYYIPAIAWGKNAWNATYLEVGTRVQLYGRIQSREYFKRFSPGSTEGKTRTAYEISIDDIRIV